MLSKAIFETRRTCSACNDPQLFLVSFVVPAYSFERESRVGLARNMHVLPE